MLRKTRALWILALGLLLSAGAWYHGALTPLNVLMLKRVTGVYPSPDGEGGRKKNRFLTGAARLTSAAAILNHYTKSRK